MKKVILEEIENMKYLLGYKRGVVISEQDVDNDINPDVVAKVEQPTTAAPTTDAPTTAAPTTAAPTTDAPTTDAPTTAAPTTAAPTTTDTETPNSTIKMGVENPRVKYLQQLLNQKFQSGLVDDGKYGPKTADAIYKNIVAISKTQLKPVETVPATQQVVQKPVQQITANTNIPR
jgi:peptidoglycan hydrolase-like protein with peptidoglycan-binding domain